MSDRLILVTNDDGIDSPGIFALVQKMRELGEVVVVAPDRQQSAVGHALTVAQPLRATKFHRNGEMFGFAINGTPSDCVKLAVSALLERKPDLIVSGINHGQNTSVNILYSGTVSAATEGMMLGVPSIAFSIASYHLNAECSVAAHISRKIAEKVLLKGALPIGMLLNVNIPAFAEDEIKGTKITRCSDSAWKDIYEKRTDPFGRDYYWFSGEYNFNDEEDGTDDRALQDGYVSITPIHYSFTAFQHLSELKYLENL